MNICLPSLGSGNENQALRRDGFSSCWLPDVKGLTNSGHHWAQLHGCVCWCHRCRRQFKCHLLKWPDDHRPPVPLTWTEPLVYRETRYAWSERCCSGVSKYPIQHGMYTVTYSFNIALCSPEKEEATCSSAGIAHKWLKLDLNPDLCCDSTHTGWKAVAVGSVRWGCLDGQGSWGT